MPVLAARAPSPASHSTVLYNRTLEREKRSISWSSGNHYGQLPVGGRKGEGGWRETEEMGRGGPVALQASLEGAELIPVMVPGSGILSAASGRPCNLDNPL